MGNVVKINQSAVLAYRINDDAPKVLLITSRRSGRWVLPKGHIEAGQTSRDAARAEAFEEAGVGGRIAETKIGTYSYTKADLQGNPAYKVKVYPMEVASLADSWPEKAERRRAWMDFPSAVAAVDEPELKNLLSDFGEMLVTLRIGQA